MKPLWSVAFLACLVLCGCARWPESLTMNKLRGEGFQKRDEDFGDLGGKFRPKSDISAVGVSAKAREIEDNLGAR